MWRREGGLMEGGRGSCSCGPCQHICPNGKEPFMASTQGQPFEKKSWEGSRGEGACLYAVSRQQLKTSQKNDILSIQHLYIGAPLFSNSCHSSLFILICSLTQHPVAPTSSPPLYSVPLILLPDYFGSDTQNGGGERRAGRQRVGAIF